MMNIDELSQWLREHRVILLDRDGHLDPWSLDELPRLLVKVLAKHEQELLAMVQWADARVCPMPRIHRRWWHDRGTWQQCLRCVELMTSHEQDEQKSA